MSVYKKFVCTLKMINVTCYQHLPLYYRIQQTNFYTRVRKGCYNNHK